MKRKDVIHFINVLEQNLQHNGNYVNTDGYKQLKEELLK